MSTQEILIAGAGPVGLSAAIALADAGIPVRVFELEKELVIDPRASTFHPPTLDMLDAYDVGRVLVENGNGPPNSEKLELTERFRRVDRDMIEYSATVDDPGAYTAPFTIRLMITSRPGYEVLEYSCHEGNGAVGHALSGERAYEKQVAEARAKGLPVPKRGGNLYGAPEEGSRIFDINKSE